MPSALVSFDAGTLLTDFNDQNPPPEALPFLKFDERVNLWRGRASDYAPLLRVLHAENFSVSDSACGYRKLPELTLHGGFSPMAHQSKALKAWLEAKGRGVVVMPTGSGKSFLAVLAILAVKRSTLVVAPTIDLVQQWVSSLQRFLGVEIGMLGGGAREIRDITVSTYDSAVLMMEFIGNRFGLAVFDECHHLPGPVNRLSASMCLAPYRLGLTATPDRGDESERVVADLIGPVVCEIFIDELEGRVLSPYETHRIAVPLSAEESVEYEEARRRYTAFIRANGIDFRSADGWSRFIMLAACRPGGRAALEAYLRQRAIARCGKGKLEEIWRILQRHAAERTILFTADNDAAYAIGNYFCFPVITHKTKVAERREFLDRFRSGEYRVLVTSKVLNEGVDVPEAAVGIVVSGSGSSREHVQRLGRILRASEGKRAELYELVSEGTSEMGVSERRRKHRAYEGRSHSGEAGEEEETC